MKKSMSAIIAFTFFAFSASAIEIKYSEQRDLNKAADITKIAPISKVMTGTSFFEFEPTTGSDFILDQFDTVWINEDASQAVLVQLDLKLEDQNLIGRTIKLDDGYLMHGETMKGSHFAAYFHGMNEEASKAIFNKMKTSEKTASIKHFLSELSYSSAYAEQSVSSCADIKGTITETKNKIKSAFRNNKWTCIKSFSKEKHGSLFNAVMQKIVDFQNGTLWTKAANALKFIHAVLGVLTDSSTLKNLTEIRFLPEKKQAELVCRVFGRTSKNSVEIVNKKSWNQADRDIIKKDFGMNLSSELSMQQSEIAKGKANHTESACSKLYTRTKTVIEKTYNSVSKSVKGSKKSQKGK